jgi:hypothetical protein
MHYARLERLATFLAREFSVIVKRVCRPCSVASVVSLLPLDTALRATTVRLDLPLPTKLRALQAIIVQLPLPILHRASRAHSPV